MNHDHFPDVIDTLRLVVQYIVEKNYSALDAGAFLGAVHLDGLIRMLEEHRFTYIPTPEDAWQEAIKERAGFSPDPPVWSIDVPLWAEEVGNVFTICIDITEGENGYIIKVEDVHPY